MHSLPHVTFDYKQALAFFDEQAIHDKQADVEAIHEDLHTRSTTGNDFKGWVNLPETYDRLEFQRIKQAARKIQAHSDVLLVIGVGGSYLGSRAAIDMLQHNFYNMLPDKERNAPQVIFAGHNMSATYVAHIKELLANRDFSINVISKSGTTTEPAIALRIFKKLLLDRYGVEGARERLFVTTDAKEGALLQLAKTRHYETFVIPDDVGGRYSVLTAVGLLPIAVSGIDIDAMMQGAQAACTDLQVPSLVTNGAYQYAVIRNILYKEGKTVELLVNYEPNMDSFSKWWQQLFGESEGKEQQGIYPSYASFPTDLHSLGQYIQDGRRDLFETIIKVDEQPSNETIHYDERNIDDLNYLAGKTLEEVNEKVYQGALLAHLDGGVPNLVIHTRSLDAYAFGYLVYFFQKACAMSGYLAQVNPFDQPGVEEYKSNMYALLGKQGFEQRKIQLEKRIYQLETELMTLNKASQ